MKLLLKKISATIFILLTAITLNPSIAKGFQIGGGDFVKQSGLGVTGVHSGLFSTAFSTGIDWTISRIITTALSLVGILFLVLMLYSGYIWMMDKGEAKDIEKAKDNIKSAIIGLIIIFGAYVITKILIPLATGPIYTD